MEEKKTKIKKDLFRGTRTLKGNSKNRGITLIALIITIVVLIILASVAINITLGNNGIINRAKNARQEFVNAQEHEQAQINDLEYQLANGLYDNDSLPENTEENPQAVGTIVKLPDEWATEAARYISTENGNTVTSVTKVATVYAVSIGNGKSVPVPYGFYYVGGDLETGVIISDTCFIKSYNVMFFPFIISLLKLPLKIYTFRNITYLLFPRLLYNLVQTHIFHAPAAYLPK